MRSNRSGLAEKRVVALWLSVLARQRRFTTVTGDSLEVLYPGKVNHGRGGDFCGAVIATSRGMRRGDIEIHRRSSDWVAHGHHADPDYNGVILHVAMTRDGDTENLQDGGALPLLTLDTLVGPAVLRRRAPRPRCQGSGAGSRALCRALDCAGGERLLQKAASFAAPVPGQRLYIELMGALGYSRNTAAFRYLATRLPLRVLEGVRPPGDSYLDRVQALLMGMAGLLPSQRGVPGPADPEATVLEGLWLEGALSDAMTASAFDMFRVRPANSPVRRLAAMSYLLLRYRQGLAAGLLNLVKAAPAKGAARFLEAGLVVPAEGYWSAHSDFGRRLPAGGALLGKDRAWDIAVNVLLPFALAHSRSGHDSELEGKCLALYHGYPPLAANSITRHMTAQLGAGTVVDSARRQQGLLRLYKDFCTQGRCGECPVCEVKRQGSKVKD